MIPLERIRTARVIHRNFVDPDKRDLEKQLLLDQRRIRRGEISKHDFKSNRWKPAKDQLKAETHDKCAYCEAPTSLVSYGDVEHYRPKSSYWWLAYSYENYLVSCQLCNQQYKQAKFPIKNTKMKGPVVRKNTTDAFIDTTVGTLAPMSLDSEGINRFIELHHQERPLLLNPYLDDPAEYFAYEADEVLGEVSLIPVPNKPDAKAFCDAAIKYYGLNRKVVRAARYLQYFLYLGYRMVLEEGTISQQLQSQIQDRIDVLKSAKAPFAGMIRYFDQQ